MLIKEIMTLYLSFSGYRVNRRFLMPFFGFLNVTGHGVGLHWTRDQHIAKASTDKGHHI
jgi:hypothetical protein